MREIYQSGFLFKSTPIPYYTCPSLGVKNAFSTRLGGISTAQGYESLDLGAGEDRKIIQENRRRYTEIFGAALPCLLTAKQIHSPKIEYVTEKDAESYFECDGFVTDRSGTLLTVKTADCVPILLSDSKNRVVAAVHSGWRGTCAGAVIEAVNKMKELGAAAECITAAIGSCIHPCCYEVDMPFKNAFEKSKYADALLQYIKPIPDSDRFTADLPKMNSELLRGVGISADRIFVSGLCTCCNKEFLFSHRGGRGKRGLMMAGIML